MFENLEQLLKQKSKKLQQASSALLWQLVEHQVQAPKAVSDVAQQIALGASRKS